MAEETLSVSGKFGWTNTQFTKDGSVECTVRGGVSPFKMRVFDYSTGQYKDWLDPIEGSTTKFVQSGLECGAYYFEILDGEATFHPYPMGEVRARHVLEVVKNDGGNAVLAPTALGEPEVIYDFVAFSSNENEVSFEKLDIMKNNVVYHEEGFKYPYNDNGCYYQVSELNKVTFDDWKVPEFTDYMYLLNQIPELTDAGIRNFFEEVLGVEYQGYVENGYELGNLQIPDRLVFDGTYAQYWLDFYSYKNRYVMSTIKNDLDGIAPEQMIYKPCFDNQTDPLSMAQARLVRRTGVITLNEYTLLEGWNYIQFPTGFSEDPATLFPNNEVYFIKTIGSSPNVGIWWPQFGLNTIGKLTDETMYAIKANTNFRISI